MIGFAIGARILIIYKYKNEIIYEDKSRKRREAGQENVDQNTAIDNAATSTTFDAALSGELTERKKIAVQITKIDENSIALLAGLEVMDIIETYNGRPISNLQDLHEAISSVSKPNTTLTVFRRKTLIELPVKSGNLGIECSTVLLGDNV